MNDRRRELPWATGPGEILRHGQDLLRKDSDVNRRLAMISIDNAVELMMKTYLGLPKRLSGLAITRKEYQEVSESFPSLLDAIEKYAADKLAGVDLGAIEWYHRLRNELYHQGNGLTVERDKVEIYAELANILFRNLFGAELIEPSSSKAELLGEFLQAWGEFERILNDQVHAVGLGQKRVLPPAQAIRLLPPNLFTKDDVLAIERLTQLRNSAAHGQPDWQSKLDENALTTVKQLTMKGSRKLL